MDDYQVSFTWMDDSKRCILPARSSQDAGALRAEVQLLTRSSTSRCGVGHFDFGPDGLMMFRHALVLPEASRLPDGSARRCWQLRSNRASAYYPAFQFVIWAGKSAREALEAAMFETRANLTNQQA